VTSATADREARAAVFQPRSVFALRGGGDTVFRAPSRLRASSAHDDERESAQFVEVGNFPVDNRRLVWSGRATEDETSVNLSAGFAVTPQDT